MDNRSDSLQIVTGAFGYSGRYITARLLQAGCRDDEADGLGGCQRPNVGQALRQRAGSSNLSG